jgi:5'-nucleotidase
MEGTVMSRMRFSGLFAAATIAAVVGCNSTTPTQTTGSWPDFESEDTTYASRIVNADSNKLSRGAAPAAHVASYETLPTTGSVPSVPSAPGTTRGSYTPVAPASAATRSTQPAGGIEFVDPSAAPAYSSAAAPIAPPPARAAAPAPARSVAPAPARSVAPATRTAAAPAARSAGSGKYVVKKGDTLWDISKARYGTALKWKQIAAANPGINPDKLPVGKTIVIP